MVCSELNSVSRHRLKIAPWQYRTGRRIFNYLGVTDSLSKSPKELLVFKVGCGAGVILKYFNNMGCRVGWHIKNSQKPVS